MNSSGGAGGSTRTGTITSTYRSGAAASNSAAAVAPGTTSFDSLAAAATLEKRSLALNSTADDELRSYDVFEAHMQQAAAMQQQQQQQQQQQANSVFGGHLSPGSQMTFADLHDVHYAPNPHAAAAVAVAAASNGGGAYDNQGYRPSTRQSDHHDLQQQQHQRPDSIEPPGYGGKADSVADMKRELKQRLEAESSSPEETNTTTSDTGSGSDHNAAATTASAASEYQTMERSPLYETSTFRPAEPRRALPNTPAADQGPQATTIPSVPGYAKPYARPFQPPPEPPASKPPRSFSYTPDPPPPPPMLQDSGDPVRRPLLLETSLDDDTLTRRQKHPTRSRSVGQILETNLDEDVEGSGVSPDDGEGDAEAHSRSLGGDRFPRLSVPGPNSLLETDM